ncbi:hypothetical protein C8J57DRAFT_1250031 [Mycena rebaudengoi]|nr:hypothetical protein C8J57DRAFT_1250031 [Mycena rebaudengoi]
MSSSSISDGHMHQCQSPPHSQGPQYVANYLGTQHESATCGFWAVYVAFAILFGFAPNNPVAHTLDAVSIQEFIGPIYASYLGHHTGVPIVLVQQLFQNFEPPKLAAPATDDLMLSMWPENISHAFWAGAREEEPRPGLVRLPMSGQHSHEFFQVTLPLWAPTKKTISIGITREACAIPLDQIIKKIRALQPFLDSELREL